MYKEKVHAELFAQKTWYKIWNLGSETDLKTWWQEN
jgi:hypothetical protein